MQTHRISARFLLTACLCLLAARTLAGAQTTDVAKPAQSAASYRIAGTVVSKTDAHPLTRARITLRDAKDPGKFETLVTSEDGRFEFTGIPAGKYELNGRKRGFISASYDQHEQFSTAIVTGAGLETESLILRLAPTAIIAGKILDESGDPVRHAQVSIYYDDHSSGVDQIHQFRASQTDDQGAFEFAPLMPGTYYLSANAKPWYAMHPGSDYQKEASDFPDLSSQSSSESANLAPSLDVAYPLTYYHDVTDADSATPIPVRGGERLQVEINLNPVPALRLRFRVPNNGNKGDIFPASNNRRLMVQRFLQGDTVRTISPGLVEISGIPAGRYNVHFYGAGSLQMSGVDLSKNGQEIDTSTGEAFSNVKIAVQSPGENSLPGRFSIGLQSTHKAMMGPQPINSRGEAEFEQVPPGRYEVVFWGTDKPYSISHISAEGAEVSGHSFTVAPGSSASVSVTLMGGSINVEGTAKRAGKPVAGAMIVLVPKNPEGNRDLFRRDQSDLDGTFSLRNVIPGSYTVLAIENGWDLDWSQPP